MPLLSFENVYVEGKSIDRLKNINLSIEKGERIALLGQSGAGKTTLISLANGNIYPKFGKVKFNDIDIKDIRKNQKMKIGTIWQDLRLIEDLTVIQNINCGALARKNLFWAICNLILDIEIKECRKALEAVNLSDSLLKSKVKNLSGGQKQRVAIARLIRQDPEILIADEPLSNLDPKLVRILINLLTNNYKNKHMYRNHTCIVSLHRPELIEGFNRVIGIKDGEIVLDKKVIEVTNREIEDIYQCH